MLMSGLVAALIGVEQVVVVVVIRSSADLSAVAAVAAAAWVVAGLVENELVFLMASWMTLLVLSLPSCASMETFLACADFFSCCTIFF